MLPFSNSSSNAQSRGAAYSSISAGLTARCLGSSSSSGLFPFRSRQGCWRSWVQQLLGGTSSSKRALHGAFSTAAAPARSAAGVAAHSIQGPSWGAGVSSWFNTMPAAAAWWDSWSLWVGEHAAFAMATLLNSLNLVGNKLPVALGLLLVDMAHNSPLLFGSRADALRPPPVLPATLPPAPKTLSISSSSKPASLAQLCRSTASNAAAVWGEVVSGLSAGARLLWLGCIWLPALLSAPVLLGWSSGRGVWLTLMTLSLEASGPAFIKWGQVGG